MAKNILSVLLAIITLCATSGFAEPLSEEYAPLVVGYSAFSQKFSPFFADSSYDADVASLVCGESLLTTDRLGGVVNNAIEGESVSINGVERSYTGPANVSVHYDSSADRTAYTVTLRDDLKFSDGTPVTADDLIFTYYVYLDPAYAGSVSLRSFNILGVSDYQTQTTGAAYEKYQAIAEAIAQAGEYADNDVFTKEQYDAYQALVAKQKPEWVNACQLIVDFVYDNYAVDYADAMLNMSYEEVGLDEGLKIALGMALWNFGDVVDGEFISFTGETFALNEHKPTIEDFYNAAFEAYAGDSNAFIEVELDGVAAASILDPVAAFVAEQSKKDPELAAGVPSISGITKLDERSVQVVTSGYDAAAIYSICDITAVPLYYYGDASMYDYDNNMFGHPFGDLSLIEQKTTQPMGWGPYKLVKYENRIVYFEANEHYYKGEPKIKHMQWMECLESDMVSGILTGAIDIAEPLYSSAVMAETAAADGKIIVDTVDYLGYGYIGMNAETMRVGDPGSQASKYYRTGLMTVFSACREAAVNSFYGGCATLINYPISNTSWAAPQPADANYKLAFSTDINGNTIYASGMDADERLEAAVSACVDYLAAAGFTWDEDLGKFTAAPEDGLLEFEAIIPANGVGDHAAFGIMTDAKAALEDIGITLNINDPADMNVLLDRLDANTQQVWAAGWDATIDPDMYQVYHSSGIVGAGGSDSNYFNVADAELDTLLLDARLSDDQSYRKAVYKACLDKIMEWAVELPAYQRQNCVLISAERVNADSIAPDITTYYGWQREIEALEML